MGTDVPPALRNLARSLLKEEGADFSAPDSVRAAIHALFQTFQGHLVPLLGAPGFEALLKRSLYLAVGDHPSLASLRVLPEPSVPLEVPLAILERPEDAAGVEEPFVDLVARFLVELGEVERDQEPSVFKLWPGLAKCYSPDDLLTPGDVD